MKASHAPFFVVFLLLQLFTLGLKTELNAQPLAEPLPNAVVCERTVVKIAPQQFLVTITIPSSSVTGHARFIDFIPDGFEVRAIDQQGGLFSKTNGESKMIWMSYPKGQARTIKYELTAVLAKTGDYLLAGDFLIESKQGSAVHLPIPATPFHYDNPNDIVVSLPKFEEELKEDRLQLDQLKYTGMDAVGGYMRAGDIFRSEGRFDEASQAYQLALEASPGNFTVQQKIRSLERARARKAEMDAKDAAIQAKRTGVKANDAVVNLVNRADEYVEKKAYDKAQIIYSVAREQGAEKSILPSIAEEKELEARNEQLQFVGASKKSQEMRTWNFDAARQKVIIDDFVKEDPQAMRLLARAKEHLASGNDERALDMYRKILFNKALEVRSTSIANLPRDARVGLEN